MFRLILMAAISLLILGSRCGGGDEPLPAAQELCLNQMEGRAAEGYYRESWRFGNCSSSDVINEKIRIPPQACNADSPIVKRFEVAIASNTISANVANLRACRQAAQKAREGKKASDVVAWVTQLAAVAKSDACKNAITGNLEKGQPCRFDDECKGNLSCMPTPPINPTTLTTQLTCQERVVKQPCGTAGGPGDVFSCPKGQLCDDKASPPVCVDVSELSLREVKAKPTKTSGSCSFSNDCAPCYQCVSGSCVAKGVLGVPCQSSSDCGSAGYCAGLDILWDKQGGSSGQSVTKAGVCQARPNAKGQPCKVRDDSPPFDAPDGKYPFKDAAEKQCAAGFWCSGELADDSKGVCEVQPKKGEACQEDGPSCIEGTVCAQGTCVEPGSLGTKCDPKSYLGRRTCDVFAGFRMNPDDGIRSPYICDESLGQCVLKLDGARCQHDVQCLTDRKCKLPRAKTSPTEDLKKICTASTAGSYCDPGEDVGDFCQSPICLPNKQCAAFFPDNGFNPSAASVMPVLVQ